MLYQLALDMRDRGRIDFTECFLDGTFASAKKGGVILDRLSEVKAPRSLSTVAHGLPLTARIFTPRPNEVTLGEHTVRSSPIKPQRVIADRA